MLFFWAPFSSFLEQLKRGYIGYISSVHFGRSYHIYSHIRRGFLLKFQVINYTLVLYLSANLSLFSPVTISIASFAVTAAIVKLDISFYISGCLFYNYDITTTESRSALLKYPNTLPSMRMCTKGNRGVIDICGCATIFYIKDFCWGCANIRNFEYRSEFYI